METENLNEEIIDDEVEREIESYQSKIAKLDERLAGFKADSIADKKRQAMSKSNYNDEQIERYLSYIDGETDEEIKESINKLILEIPPNIQTGDPSLMNGEKAKPTTADPGQLGKQLYERIKHKVRWGL